MVIVAVLRHVSDTYDSTSVRAAVTTGDPARLRIPTCVRQQTHGYGWPGVYVSRNVFPVVIATVGRVRMMHVCAAATWMARCALLRAHCRCYGACDRRRVGAAVTTAA